MTMIMVVAQTQVILTRPKVIAVTTASTNDHTTRAGRRRRVIKSHLWILTSLVVFIMVLRIRILGRNALSTQQIGSSIKAITLTKKIGTTEPITTKVIRAIKINHIRITKAVQVPKQATTT